MLIVTYLLCIIPSFLMGFGNESRGSLFSEKVKGNLSSGAIVLSIGACAAVTIYFSWLHIAGIIFSYCFFSWIGANVAVILINRAHKR